VGFGATPQGVQLHDVWQRLGLRRLTVDQVLATVEMALRQDEPNLTVVAWDDAATDPLPWAGVRPALESLAAPRPMGTSLNRLNELDGDERIGYIVEVIRTRIAHIMGCAPDDVDPHQSLALMGIDSLIALEVLFIVEREFAVRLGLDHVLLGGSANLVEMAGQLDQRIRALAVEVAR
jgi:acyl carrier protein